MKKHLYDRLFEPVLISKGRMSWLPRDTPMQCFFHDFDDGLVDVQNWLNRFALRFFKYALPCIALLYLLSVLINAV